MGEGNNLRRDRTCVAIDARSDDFSASYLFLTQTLVNELAEYARGRG